MKRNYLYTMIITGLLSANLFAQEVTQKSTNAPTKPNTTNSGLLINEIIVEGQKLDRSLQDTVSGTSVLYDVLLADTETKDLSSSLILSANVNHIDTGNYDSFAIRGIDVLSSTGSAGELASTFIDGAYMPSNVFYSNVQLWDLDQISVNKGPQSTTSGRNSLAGSINLTYKRPEFDNTGSVRLGIGSNNQREASFMLNRSLTDNFAVRISGQHNRNDGQVTNVYLNDDKHDFAKNTTVRIGALYEPTDDLKVLATAGYIDDSHGVSLLCTEKNSSAQYKCKGNSFQANQEFKPSHDFKSNYGTLTVSKDLNDRWSLTSTTSFTNSLDKNFDDSDRYHPNAAAVATSAGEKLDSTPWKYEWDKTSVNQELKLTFENEMVRSATGVYYAKNSSTRTTSSSDPQDFSQFISGIDSSGTLTLAPEKEYIRIASHDLGSTEDVTSFAIFNDTDIKINDDLTLNVGLRYDNETVKATNKNRSTRADDLTKLDAYLPDVIEYTPLNTTLRNAACGLNPQLCSASFTQIIGALQGSPMPELNALADQFLNGAVNSGYGKSTSKKNHAFLPKIGFRYKINEDVTIGYLYSRGYRSGGAGYNLGRAQMYEYDSEYLDNHELSLKSSLLDNNLTINVNAYYAKWKNQQVNVYGGKGPYDVYKANSGKSQMYGLEIESRYFDDSGLYGFANLGLSKSEFKEFKNNGVDYSGKQFAGAPNVSASVGIGYNTGEGFNASWVTSYTGDIYQSIDNKRKSDAFAVSNVKIGYAKDNWQVNAFVKNIFDKDTQLKYWDFGGRNQYAPVRAQLPGRSFGVTAQYDF